MKNAAAIDIKPDTDMDGIAGLTHENTVTLGGQRDLFPTAAFRVISKTPCNCENILRVGNGGQFPAKMLPLDVAHEGPAVKTPCFPVRRTVVLASWRPFPSRRPGNAKVCFCPMHDLSLSDYPANPGNRFTVYSSAGNALLPISSILARPVTCRALASTSVSISVIGGSICGPSRSVER